MEKTAFVNANDRHPCGEIDLIEAITPAQIDDIRLLFLEYARSLDFNLCFQDFDAELEALPGKYAPPDGALILARVNGQSAGCIALRKIEDGVCEMKRLYVRDEYRGLKIGRLLIARIIEEAEIRNYQSIRLDTAPDMKAAQSLYESFGFRDIEPYIYNPLPGARYMERVLERHKTQ
jgi:ribosomal protein S18 acetylase RimI-like enzyme